ncbi:MAG: phenylalanine--tRNA ligase subunit beta [Patescibacteria group bacterium]
MIFSYNWLQSLIKQKLPEPKKVAELLTMHSFEIDELKKVGTDYVFDIAVLPNRGHDCFSHEGIIREIVTLMGIKYTTLDIQLKEDESIQAKDFISVEIKDKECRRYVAGVMIDVKLGESPDWLKERLMACGLRPINNIVDVANYIMLETGQPLHVFDAEKIHDRKIIVRKGRSGEKLETLDDEIVDLDSDILLITDSSGPLAVAGIKGGKGSGIDKNTKTIIVESANFEPMAIRRGSKKLKLKTDASWRFEHDLDVNIAPIAVKRAMFLIQEVAGGKIAKGLVDIFSSETKQRKLDFRLSMTQKMLGIEIAEKDIKGILDRLGFGFKEKEDGLLEILIPTIRGDITIVEDLVEEIGRVWGFNNIPAVFPNVLLTIPKFEENAYWEQKIKKNLKEIKFIEVYNKSFIGEKEIELLGVSKEDLIEVTNPPSADYQYMRPDFLVHLMNNIAFNQKSFSQFRLFELGKIFDNSEGERRLLAGVIMGYEFYDAKGVIEALLANFNVSDISFIKPEKTKVCWDSSMIAEIMIGKEIIGSVGKINKKWINFFKINGDVFGFKIDFEKLQNLAKRYRDYVPLSPYPSATRDLAVLVPLEIPAMDVVKKIKNSGKLLKNIEIFDVYSGEGIPDNKKNIAFHLIYQSQDHTLETKEIDEIHQNIIKDLEANPEFMVRK